MVVTLNLTDDQVIGLLKQLPVERQRAIVSVIIKDWLDWGELSRYGEERARATAAKRGRNWNTMTSDEREAFIDELVHEDRK